MIEEQILHTIITNKNAMYEALNYESSIFTNKNKILFDHIKDICASGQDIDFTIIMSYLRKLNKYDVFGDDYFVDLMAKNTCFNIDVALRNLHEKHIRSQMQLNSVDLYKSLQQGKIDYDLFIEKILQLRDSLEQNEEKSINVKSLSSANLDDIFKHSNYLPFGIYMLDKNLKGLFNSNLITIAGEPGAGKTSLALQIACNNKTLFFSLEMQKEELYSKILSRLCSIPSLRIETKELAEFEYAKILEVHNKIKENMDVEIITNASNYYNIRHSIKYYVKKYNYQMVVIDYLQLVRTKEKDTNTALEYMTADLKNLAKELNIPIIILSQLTKESYKMGAAPTLASLRGSGSIGQNSDVVFILWNDENKKLNFSVAKGRKYKKGTIDGLWFNGEFSRFEERYFF